MLCCKTDSDRTQTLLNSQDLGGLWRVNDNLQNIFIECEEIFCLSTSNFQAVINSPQLVQEMQSSLCVFSNFDGLCYNIEPKVNEEISLNLLENMLLLFTKVCAFSFARDVKERFKARIKNPKKSIVKKRDQKGLLLQKFGSINGLMQQSPDKDFIKKGYLNSNTILKKHYF